MSTKRFDYDFESFDMTQPSQGNVSAENFESLFGRISETVRDLEKSVRISQQLERKQFQNELQLHIDKHQLSLNLDQQIYHNKRLTRLAMSLSDSSSGGAARPKAGACSEDIRTLTEKCEELKTVLRKRESQLRKTRAALKQVTEDNVKLAEAYESRNGAYKELSGKHEALRKELNNNRKYQCERGHGENSQCEHQAALQEIQMFYEAQIAEMAARLEEQQLISGCLEEQQLLLAQEQSLAEFEKSESKKSGAKKSESRRRRGYD